MTVAKSAPQTKLPICVQYWDAAAIDQKSELPWLTLVEATGAMDQFKVIADQYVQ